MTRGRKPLPTVVKIAKNTARKHRLNKNEPKPSNDKVLQPDGLSAAAVRVWNEKAWELKEIGTLTNIDCISFGFYCEAVARCRLANDILERDGLTITSPKGYVMPSPYLAIYNKAEAQAKSWAVEFGMTAASRSRVVVKDSADKKSKNPFANLPGGKR